MIVNAVLVGLFKPILSSGVTLVNARSVAAERGIEVVESRSTRPRNYTSLLSVKLHTSDGERWVEGAVFERTSPRLVLLDGIAVEAPLEGTMIVIRNNDQPGVIGDVGTILGRHGVNIANFALGRDGRPRHRRRHRRRDVADSRRGAGGYPEGESDSRGANRQGLSRSAAGSRLPLRAGRCRCSCCCRHFVSVSLTVVPSAIVTSSTASASIAVTRNRPSTSSPACEHDARDVLRIAVRVVSSPSDPSAIPANASASGGGAGAGSTTASDGPRTPPRPARALRRCRAPNRNGLRAGSR